MKKVTSILAIVFTAAMFSTSFIGCKKSENDPFLSLKSRDGRITGTWKMTKLEKTTVNSGSNSGNSTSTTTSEAHDGSVRTSSNSFGTTSRPYTYEITIEKDGTWSSVTVDDGDTDLGEGVWYWMNSRKNKTGIFIGDSFWNIDQLKNKELIVKDNEYEKSTDSDGDYNEKTVTSTTTYTKS